MRRPDCRRRGRRHPGLGSALLPCGIKTQGIVNDEIIQGGTVAVGNGPRIEQKVIIFDPFLFEDLVMGKVFWNCLSISEESGASPRW